MKCEQAEMRMAELLAGEIAPEERAGLEKHLLDCASCRGDFELARAGARIEWADVSVPQEVIESTLASFREPTPVVRLLRWATAAAAVFGVAVLLMASSRAVKPAAPPPLEAGCSFERPQVLATMQDAVVGALVCKDEDGRPVGELGLKSHDVSVEILDGIAKTTVEENFENHTDRRLEGTFNFPLPSDASISRLALEVNGKIEEGTCLERERAREVFEGIVRRMQDPALLEWQPGGFFKCRVFPIEPRSTKRVIVAYTQALPCFQGKMTYVYPLASEKTRTHPPGEVTIGVQARFSGALSKIESPSHHLEVQRKNPNEASMAFRAANYRPNNDFVVTMEPGDEEVRVVSHKTDGEDGYFACFATPKGGGERTPGRYAFVLDVSASISAPRLEVAKRLVRAMMERRIDGDRFEILAHNVDVERSGEVDLRAANTFMDRLRPIGGSDVLQALLAAGDAEVLYIGKGACTAGESEPSKILEAVKGRRIRTIAVGSDANGTLLERLGGMMRVNPNDDVAKRVAEIAATLGSPVLSELKIDGGDAVYDVVGVRDLFYGERLVVSGRYRGAASKLVISGRGYGREVEVAFPAKEEGNNYVRRLWAQRKVSDLLAEGPAKKPEVTEMGVKYQIMTPYTSFLVLETEQMWKDHQLKREVQKQDEVLSAGDKTRGLMEEGVALYKKGKAAEASAKFEQAFEMKPSSDQVYAFIRRAGVDVVAQMMNDPERKTQDIGRRLMELSKPGLGFREGQAVVATYLEELKSEDHAVWRNSFWHLKNIGRHSVKDLLPALGDQTNDRYRSRMMLLLNELGTDVAPAVTEALQSRDPFVRANAAIVLGNIKDGRSLPALQRASEDPNERAEVRKVAAEAVRKISRSDAPNPPVTNPSEMEKIAQELSKGRSQQDQQQILESQRHYEQALMFNKRGDFDKAKIEAQKSIESWHENVAARKLLNDVNRATVGGREDARDDFRVRTEQAQIDITKHVRDGERYLNARMYEEAKREFEDAEFKILNIPYEVRAMNDLLPHVKDAVVKSKNAKILEERRTEEERRRMGEAERPRTIVGAEWDALLDKLKANYALTEQQKASEADEHYRLAERSFQAGDFEKSEVETQKALQINPNHAASRALYTENMFIQGKGRATPSTGEYDKFMHQAIVRHQQVLTEVDNAQERGTRAYNRGEYALAEREFRKIVEYSKWMPTGIELEARRKAAVDMLGRTRNLEGRKESMREVEGGVAPLDSENSGKAARINELQRELDLANTLATKYEGDMQVFVRQLEVQLAQIQELTTKVDEYRGKLARSLNEKSLATGELQFARQQAERLQQDLGQLEEKHVEMARDKMHLEEKMNAIVHAGGNVNVAPKKALEAKVTAVAHQIGLVVISIGKDDGAVEGDEFTVYRGGDFVAKIVIDRSDRKWSAGKVVLKKTDPRVADDVSNHIFVSSPRAGSNGDGASRMVCAVPGLAMDLQSASDDAGWIILTTKASGVAPQQFYAVTRAGKFVALIRVEKVMGAVVEARVWQSLAVGRLLPGDRAEVVVDHRSYLASLPAEVRLDLSSRTSQQTIRAKMGMKE